MRTDIQSQTAPDADAPGGLIGGLLTGHGPHLPDLTGLAEHYAIPLAATVVAAVTAVVAVTGWMRRYRERRWADGARLVEILVPPQVQPDSAQVFWEHLHGAVARTRRQRLLFGQHLLGFEYRIAPDEGAVIGVWVPSCVPPHLVEHAVSVAWRGARTRTQPATPPLPAAPAGKRSLIAGGELRNTSSVRGPQN